MSRSNSSRSSSHRHRHRDQHRSRDKNTSSSSSSSSRSTRTRSPHSTSESSSSKRVKTSSSSSGFGFIKKKKSGTVRKNAFNALESEAPIAKPVSPLVDLERQQRLERLQAWKLSQEAKALQEPSPSATPMDAHVPRHTPNDSTRPDESEEAGIDPLDAYMKELLTDASALKSDTHVNHNDRYFENQEVYSDDDLEAMGEDDPWIKLQKKKFRKKEIKDVDHSTIQYAPFRKNFYVEAREIKEMSAEAVNDYRLTALEGVTLRPIKIAPRPIMKWTQCGLSQKMLSTLDKLKFTTPFPIQAQAIPTIMSGHDCICCAKTGSGKTLAFVLPLLRHAMDQPSLSDKDGPIGLILAPTRELAIQIHAELKKLAKPLGLRSVCCYGGTGISEQIAMLKRGAEILVATPGRLIDMLCANSGRVTNLRRVTYVVLDEADRMFDMGFEPQVMMVLKNTRPDRQTVLFSATFPQNIEKLAKQALKPPLIEIVIGGRSVASNTIAQYVEVLEPSDKFKRLLQIVGEWYQKGSILVFCDRQDAVDKLYGELMQAGYPCLALHGGMDQSDRDYTLLDFKKGERTLMVASSVAARGLDVKTLRLVVNYNVPNHYEDYVHRVGRTGRAGTKGTAYTFVSPSEESNAMEMVKALKASNQPISAELQALSDTYWQKLKDGLATYSDRRGFVGKGFKFDEEEAQKVTKEQARQRRTYGAAEDRDTDEEIEEAEQQEETKKAEKAAEEKEAVGASSITATLKALQAATKKAAKGDVSHLQKVKAERAAALVQSKLGAIASAASAVMGNARIGGETEIKTGYNDEIEINDYPQHARWTVTQKKFMSPILEMYRLACTPKGTYVDPKDKKASNSGVRKLYLFLEATDPMELRKGKKEIRRLLEEARVRAENRDPEDSSSSSSSSSSRYKVV